MISKIVNWFRGLKKSPVDKLIELTGVNNVTIWNGINYNQEYRLAPSDMKEFDCKPTEFPLIRIGIGRYISGYGDWVGGDYESCAIVEITIDEYRNIRRVKRNSHYYNGGSFPAKIEKKIDKLVERLENDHILNTINSQLLKWIKAMFDIEPEVRYKHCFHVDDILCRNAFRVSGIRERLNW